MASKISIFSFDDHVAFLQAHADGGIRGGRRKRSLTVWAKQLGYRSSRSFGMVLNGRRLPSAEMVQSLSRLLRLDEREHRYLELLVERRRAEAKQRPVAAIDGALRDLRRPVTPPTLIDARAFAVIADWHHLVIRQLLRSSTWRGGVAAISKRLGGKVKIEDVRDAIARMARLGLVKRDGGRWIATEASLHTKHDIPSSAYVMHHKQMLARTLEAIDHVASADREMTTTALLCEPARLDEAREMIRAFREDFVARFESTKAKDVFQLAVQFFPHTSSRGS
jgi:uncharacterized protein (TIGR02147 family)